MTVATEHVLYFVATIGLLTLKTTGQPRGLYGRRGNRVLLEKTTNPYLLLCPEVRPIRLGQIILALRSLPRYTRQPFRFDEPRRLDALGLTLSGLCWLHCVALPVDTFSSLLRGVR